MSIVINTPTSNIGRALATRLLDAGTGAAVVGAVARPLAREGAKASLTDWHLASVHNKVAKDILFVGGIAEVSRVDARDEPAVDAQV